MKPSGPEDRGTKARSGFQILEGGSPVVEATFRGAVAYCGMRNAPVLKKLTGERARE